MGKQNEHSGYQVCSFCLYAIYALYKSKYNPSVPERMPRRQESHRKHPIVWACATFTGRAGFAGINSPIGSVISCLMSLSLLLWKIKKYFPPTPRKQWSRVRHIERLKSYQLSLDWDNIDQTILIHLFASHPIPTCDLLNVLSCDPNALVFRAILSWLGQ